MLQKMLIGNATFKEHLYRPWLAGAGTNAEHNAHGQLGLV